MSSTPPPPSGGSWGWDESAGQQGHWPTPPIRPQQPDQPPRHPQQPTPQQPPAQQYPQHAPQQPQFAPPPPPGQPPHQQPSQQAYPQQAHQQHYQQPATPHQQSPQQQPPKRSRGGLIALIACVVLVLGVGVGWGLSRFLPGDDGSVVADPTQAPTSGTSDSSSPDVAAPDAPDATDGAGPDSTDGTDALPDDPSDALTQIAETDREEVVADLEGKWVPQISSKRAGMEIDGETWTDEDILADHQALRDEHPRVRLLWSGDFGSFKEDDFWVTIAGIGYSDPDQALSWCATNGLGPDDCYAKQLNTGGDDEGTTRLQ